MSESRGGESRSYSNYTPSYRSYGESRNNGESRTSTPIYRPSVGESRESGESRGSSYTPSTPKSTTGKSKDIGDIRSQVMQELYDELYGEIKQEVRQELEKEKPEIVREIKDELKEKLKEDLKRNLTQGRGEDR